MSENFIGWRFPANDDGEDDHLNHPGIEDFRNTPIISLAREICQNSLDAKDPESHAPVEVHFSLLDLQREDFPEVEEFAETLKSCLDYQPDSQKSQAFFNRALNVIAQPSIRCLAISDFNTTGLRGVAEGKGSDWYKLTKAVGSSDKAGGLGSFGIGKFAPYANSELRTVFYSTRNVDKEIAFQGVARLISHEHNGRITRGTGYFGVRQKNEPIVENSHVPRFINREKLGTTILIAGFPDVNDWEQEIVTAVLESFFYAILSEKLVVKAGDRLVNKANLAAAVEQLKNPAENVTKSYTPAYYDSLVSSDALEFVHPNFEEMGRISLRILVGRDLPKKVAMVRGSGMKIFDKGNFMTPLRFAGVFNAEGDLVNSYLKGLEPQQHDGFYANRADDPAEARKFLRKLYAWINEQVRSIAEEQATEESDIEGVSRYLPDDVDEQPGRYESEEVDEPTQAAQEIRIVIKRKEVSPTRIEIPAEPAIPDDEEIPVDFPHQETIEPNDELTQPNPPSDGVPFGQIPSEDGAGVHDASSGGRTSSQNIPIGLSYQRLYSSSRSFDTFVVNYQPEKSCDGTVALTAIGETGLEPIPISSARALDSGATLPVDESGRIGPLQVQAGTKYSIEVKVGKPVKFALGVSLNAN